VNPSAGAVTAGVLTGFAGLHVAWGFGASMPATDRRELADLVAGSPELPGPVQCFAVAGALAVAAALVSDLIPMGRPIRQVGVIGVASALGGRSALGLLGRTGAIVPWTPSARFAALDRRYYAPLCALLAIGALTTLRS
jgi:hypothetical protein